MMDVVGGTLMCLMSRSSITDPDEPGSVCLTSTFGEGWIYATEITKAIKHRVHSDRTRTHPHREQELKAKTPETHFGVALGRRSAL